MRAVHLHGSTGKVLFIRVSPIWRAALRSKPMDLGVRVELLLAQNRVGQSEGDHAPGKPINLLMLFKVSPINPTGFIVLAIGVVVAALGAAEFISAQQHWHAARNQQGQQKVLDLALAHKLDAVILRRSLHSIIAAEIFVCSVVVVFRVGFIVFD